MREFWLCFVPLFVAVNALGFLPLYMSITEGTDGSGRRRILAQSVITASAVALVFLVAGKLILRFVGVTVADFLVAGGLRRHHGAPRPDGHLRRRGVVAVAGLAVSGTVAYTGRRWAR